MRVVLGIFVLATLAVGWAAGAHGPARARVSSTRGSLPDLLDLAELDVGCPEHPEATCGSAVITLTTRPEDAEVTIAPVEIPDADAVPVEVVLVDGQNGDVLRRATTTVRRGPEGTITYDVAAPDGYVPDVTGARQIKAYISRRAERVRVVEPLRHEADIRLHVLDAGGRPAQGARVTEVLLGGEGPSIIALAAEEEEEEEPEPDIDEEIAEEGARLPQARADVVDLHGWTRVRGVPDLVDERYWIVAGKGRAEALAEVRSRALGETYAPEVRLPVASRRPATLNSCIGLGGGGGSGYRGRARKQVPATLIVVVRRSDGRMGVGLDVLVGGAKAVTDAGGRATFVGLQPGRYSVEVCDPDFTWSTASVDLHAGEWRAFAFDEAPGWTARLLLVDSFGGPVPFARATVSSRAPVPYLRLEDGVQDLALYTDVNGELRLPGMHHAPVRVTFRYGSRSESVTLEESEPYARVQLPPP